MYMNQLVHPIISAVQFSLGKFEEHKKLLVFIFTWH